MRRRGKLRALLSEEKGPGLVRVQAVEPISKLGQRFFAYKLPSFEMGSDKKTLMCRHILLSPDKRSIIG